MPNHVKNKITFIFGEFVIASWTVWEYENNAFVSKTYGLGISSTNPTITPDSRISSAVYKNSKWNMASGYGFTISYSPVTVCISGYRTPPVTAYTGVQEVNALFPEFAYSTEYGSYRFLELNSSVWKFAQNENADGNARLHFTPLWFPSGNYTVSVIATDVWTPAGMISAQRNSNTIVINDSAYDDWHITHN